MKILVSLLALGAALDFVPASAEAKPRAARCVIDAAGTPRWSGPCQFAPERGGSFTIFPSRGRFSNGTTSIGLTMIRPGVGEVRGVTALGVNSRWGQATRSRRDGACWVGADFSLCVY